MADSEPEPNTDHGPGADPPTATDDHGTIVLGPASRVTSSPSRRPAGPPPIPETTGTVLGGRYLVGGQVGEGGMGVVLRVLDLKQRRELALKLMKPEAAADLGFVRRFLEEAEVCGRLQHPGVVPLHEVDWLPDGRPFFTMKLILGRTLADLLREVRDARNEEGALPPVELSQLVKVFDQLCQTIAYAHANGVVHRDLKPANVMVGEFGEVQVMDWGLAKDLRKAVREAELDAQYRQPPGNDHETRVGEVLGTPSYMSPEQSRGEAGRLNPRSDVFGLGAILCEILTGQPVYAGTHTGAWEAGRSGRIDPALERLQHCGAEADLTDIVRACLAVDPTQRPTDAGEVAGLLAHYLAGLDVRLLHAQERRWAAEARAQAEYAARTEAEVRRRIERQRFWVALMLAAMLLIVLVVTWMT